jgi:CRISPR-associated endonuclease/helicase Cas3
MSVSKLLAKSLQKGQREPRNEQTLQGHTARVLEAARKLVALRGASSLAAAGLISWDDAVSIENTHSAAKALYQRLCEIVQRAAFLHDLGKCSDHFQEMLQKGRTVQLARHEALSLFLCWPGQVLAAWLSAGMSCPDDYLLAVLAGAGHHRKFAEKALAPQDAGAGAILRLLVSHPDFSLVLRTGASQLGLGAPPSFASPLEVKEIGPNKLSNQLIRWEKDAGIFFSSHPEQARLLPLAKALVIAADVAGSAISTSEEKLSWIDRALNERASQDERRAVVQHRLRDSETGLVAPLRAFQEETGLSTAPITLLKAGCGTGKTLAAYQWSAEQHPRRQLWLTYPTTGTATEGFRDYLNDDQFAFHARLDHSRARIDIEIFSLRDGEDTPQQGESAQRELDRLDSLRNWQQSVVVCTVDAVLGLVQNQRRGLYAWPGLCEGAVVFDEAHAYDDELFGALLRFLEALPGIPVLLMTASLPAPRLQALETLSQRVHGRPLACIGGPLALEALPRYRLAQAAEEDKPWPEVCAALARGERVLWVSNTVERCMKTFEEARACVPPGAAVFLYHSRFAYKDRVRHHRALMDAFKQPGPGGVLACTTQVAEMSLDLSADLLVSDLAPIPALIQRLGRLNRRSTPESPRPVRPFFLRPVSESAPYEPAALTLAEEWARVLQRQNAGPGLSQRDLVEAWPQNASLPAPSITRSAWLDGGYHTVPVALRGSTPGITVLREADLERLRGVKPHEKAGLLQRISLPMNAPCWIWKHVHSWPSEGFYPVVPNHLIDYDPERGARWIK